MFLLNGFSRTVVILKIRGQPCTTGTGRIAANFDNSSPKGGVKKACSLSMSDIDGFLGIKGVKAKGSRELVQEVALS